AGEAALSGGGRLGVKQRAGLEGVGGGGVSSPPLAGGGGCGRPKARGAVALGPARQTRRRLEQRALVATHGSRLRRAPVGSGLAAPATRPELLPEQAQAAAAIGSALAGAKRATERRTL